MATKAAHDIMRAREREALTSTSDKLGGRNIAASIGYMALYLALDRLSFIGALHGVGITPWNPSTGLAVALMLIKGLRYAPLVLAVDLLSSATLPIVPISPVPVCLGSLVSTAGYTGAA